MTALPLILVTSLVGALLVLLLGRKFSAGSVGTLAFVISLLPLGQVLYVLKTFDFSHSGVWQHLYERPWIPGFGISLSLGVDAISLWLIVLAAVLTPLAILASFKYIKERQAEFYFWMLLLHASMVGVFCARDLLVFYLFFEFTLIPMFFIIGIWGGSERRKAAGKFFLFTFAGSVLTLVSLLYVAFLHYKSVGHLTFSIEALYRTGQGLSPCQQYLLFLGLMAGFAVKVPLFPVHTWLPLAHTEAPTAGSVILAGVLLKLGTYGLLRLSLPMFPAAVAHFAPLIATLCIIGIIYGALVSWVQGDMKKLIAYSSVSHLGFCVLGLFALTSEGLSGSIMYMINHGISTGALFLVVGMIYERYHTRDMERVSGLARRLPVLACFAVFFVLSSIALPGLNGFISEFLVLLGTFTSGRTIGTLGPKYAVFAATGVILGAVYMLYWAGRVIFGPLKEPAHESHHESHGEEESHAAVTDLSLREWAVLTPLAILVLVLGIYPKPVLDSLQPAIEEIQKVQLHSANAGGHEVAAVVPACHAALPLSH